MGSDRPGFTGLGRIVGERTAGNAEGATVRDGPASRVCDDLLPYADGDVADTLARLVEDKDLLQFLAGYRLPRLNRMFPSLTQRLVQHRLRGQIAGVSDIEGFQNVMSHYARRLVQDTMTFMRYEGVDALPEGPCLFVGNHRDIAADSMCLNYALYYSGRSTVRIAVGDNLIQRSFATDLMRLNKSFFIQRNVPGAKRQYAALLGSSRFIHESLDAGESVWIAQSEGRAKDGVDVTDPAIIKMFTLADRRAELGALLRRLRVVPVSIAYEYDPCDVLKARELTLREAEGDYEKPAGEDLRSLALGLAGHKGRVVLRVGSPLVDDFESPEAVALEIDRQILGLYQLFPVNYLALEVLSGIAGAEAFADAQHTVSEAGHFQPTAETRAAFAARIDGCPPEYRRRWLESYANPIVNKLRCGVGTLAPI